MSRVAEAQFDAVESSSDIDLRAIGAALKRRRRVYLIPTLAALVGIGIYVNVISPRYTAQAQLLLENQETFFTRPDRVNLPPETASQLDEAAVASQVQLIDSPELARRAVAKLGLVGNSEFDPTAGHGNPIAKILEIIGVGSNVSRDTAESRTADNFLKNLTVYSPPKTRVVMVEFTSKDARLAARAANTIAQLYLDEQSAAKRKMARGAAEALSAQISDLRGKLAKADAERESYRSASGLLAGTNNMTITGQQLADINTDLGRARTTQADAQAKAAMIRQLLSSGHAADVADVTNNDIVRRVWDQRATAQAQLAEESRTLLPGHPRIKELTAQVAQFDAALKGAARQAANALENEAGIAGRRVANLETILNQQKQAAGAANNDEIHLAALTRVAQSYKDQLESSTTKYEEALARQSSTATPADARVISEAATPQLPSFPKKLPFVIFGTVATLVFSAGYVIAAELLSGNAFVSAGRRVERRDDIWQPTLPFEAPIARHQPPDPPVAVEPAPPVRKAPEAEAGPNPRLGDMPAHVEDDLVFAPVSLPLSKSRASSASLLGRIGAYLSAFGQSAEASLASKTDDAHPEVPRDIEAIRDEPSHFDPEGETDASMISELTDEIVGAHVPGRGLHIVGAALSADKRAAALLIALGRELSIRGRSIMIDLGTTPVQLASLAARENGLAKVTKLQGLSELLAGEAGFAEVIHRDCASRLHFVPTGARQADFRDFDLVLDALSETYDFVVLLSPAYSHSEIAKVMAPYADFMVLAVGADEADAALDMAEREMREAGARRVLVAGDREFSSRTTQDVA